MHTVVQKDQMENGGHTSPNAQVKIVPLSTPNFWQEHTTEYVNCEHCGSRVPAAEYETGE